MQQHEEEEEELPALAKQTVRFYVPIQVRGLLSHLRLVGGRGTRVITRAWWLLLRSVDCLYSNKGNPFAICYVCVVYSV